MKKNVNSAMILSLVVLSVLISQGLAEAQGPSIFGAQMNNAIDEAEGLSQALAGGVYWVRFDAFEWDRIEPVPTVPSTFHWENVDESSLQRANQNGLNVIAVVKYTPDWAQKYPGSACGPVKSKAFAGFAEFLAAVVNRYKGSPYNIKYWELGNEIDAPVYYERSVFGCWGDGGDPYFGGEYYAQMLKAAYPAIKAADPEAQVLLGGLVLDNPNEIPYTIARFLEGVLRGGGGPFFDLVNFHSYSYFTGVPGLLYNPNWPGSPTALPEKTAFLKNILNRYGWGNKPLINTETALYCDVNSDPCLETQAVFVAKAYADGIALGLQGLVYYALKSEWRLTGLLRPDNTPRPSYLAFKTAADFLSRARYRGPVSGYPAGIFGHTFWPQVGTSIEVIWATDGAPQSVPLPSGAEAFDLYGTPLSVSGGAITVDYGPVYIRKFYNTLNPISSMTSLPPESLFTVSLSWSGQGAGSISSYDLQVRMGLDGQWTDLLPDTILTSTNYDLVPGITYYFRVRAKDIDGKIEDWPVQYNTSTSVDFTKPASSMAALPANSSTSMILNWSGFDALSGVAGYDLQVRAGTDGQWIDLLVNTTATSTTYTVTNDTTYYFRVRARDVAGNVEDWPSDYDTFTLVDTVAPTGSLVINNGARSTTFADVQLALSGEDVSGKVTQMRFSNEGTVWSEWESYAGSKSWTLTSGDGLKTVWVQFQDEAGNVSVPISSSITLDLAAGGEYALSINQGAPFTNQTLVTLTIGSRPFTSEMMVSNDVGFAGAYWEPYNSLKPWQIKGFKYFVSPRVVYIRYKNADGSISSSYQDDIILDVNPPLGDVRIVALTANRIIISEPDRGYPVKLPNVGYKIFLPVIQNPLQGTLVKLELTASDDVSGVGQMLISNNADFSGASWEPYRPLRDWGMTGSTIYVKFKDNAGNISKIYSASRP